MQRFDKMEKTALCNLMDRRDKTLSNYSYSYDAYGGEVWKFEKEFARWLGRKYAVAVNSGTSALMVALKAFLYKSRNKFVTIPPYTFVADAESVLASGGRPWFGDIDPETYLLAEFKVDSYVTSPVHTLGNVCNPSSWKDLKGFVLEDTAQCVGGRWKGKLAGNLDSDIAMFSFQGTKTISTGEGGMIATDDRELYERCAGIRNHMDYYKNNFPIKEYPYLEMILGYNLRMTEMQACVGRCQLKKLPVFLKEFKENAELIFDLLPNGIEKPYYPSEVTPAYFILGCMYKGKHRDKFLEKLNHERKKKGLMWSSRGSPIGGANSPAGYIIGSGYKKLLYELPLYSKYKRATPNADYVRNNVVWFDIHRFSEKPYVEQVMEIVNKVYREVEG